VQRPGIQGEVGQDALDRVREGRSHDLVGRDVHGHGGDAQARALPQLQVRARPAKHRVAQAQDEARPLGHWDDDVGADRPALRVVPAQQRLHSLQTSGVDVEDGLVEQRELGAFLRVQQVAFQVVATVRSKPGAGVQDLVGTPAPALCLVHGEVGVAQQRGRDVLTRTGEGDADADR